MNSTGDDGYSPPSMDDIQSMTPDECEAAIRLLARKNAELEQENYRLEKQIAALERRRKELQSEAERLQDEG